MWGLVALANASVVMGVPEAVMGLYTPLSRNLFANLMFAHFHLLGGLGPGQRFVLHWSYILLRRRLSVQWRIMLGFGEHPAKKFPSDGEQSNKLVLFLMCFVAGGAKKEGSAVFDFATSLFLVP